jgi:small subunit ribosomal protein S5
MQLGKLGWTSKSVGLHRLEVFMSKNRREKVEEGSNLIEKVIHINRVAKVVKGGRRFSFSAIVVVGNGEGEVGFGFGKANEVPEAIRKATEKARKTMRPFPLVGGTLAHIVQGRYGSGNVLLKPASPGTGVIAGPAVRSIMDALGVQDVLTKCIGTTNPHNVVRATFVGLDSLESAEQYATRTGQNVETVYANYTVVKTAAVS